MTTREDIGQMAGDVWNLLGDKGEITLSELPRRMKAKGDIAFQALGWLAREEKISYHSDRNGRIKVALTEVEQRTYQRSR